MPRTNALTLVYKSTDPSILEMPDNLLVLPRGDIVLCEGVPGLRVTPVALPRPLERAVH